MYTNKPFGTAYRGFGHVEFSWGVERHMDLCARTIDMDPLEFRKKNALKPGSVTLTGEVITESTGNVTKCMEGVAKEIRYGEWTEEEKKRQEKTGKKMGKSVVALHKAPAMPPFTATSAIIKMNENGSVNVNLSLTEMGQGTYTSLAQIIAEILRFPLDKIHFCMEIDTEKDPYDWQTVASKGLLMSGNACILAAEDLLKKAYELAGAILRAQPCDLDHDQDKIFIRHHPHKHVTFPQIAVGYVYPDGNGVGGPLVGSGKIHGTRTRKLRQGHWSRITGPRLDIRSSWPSCRSGRRNWRIYYSQDSVLL